MTKSQAFFLWTILVVGLIAASITPSLSPPSAHNLDLVVHFGVYVVLAALPAVLFGRLGLAIALGVLLAGVGLGIEVAQSYIPGRNGSELDLFANCLGIGLGLAAGRLLRRYASLRAL
jgi:VanZ family protein